MKINIVKYIFIAIVSVLVVISLYIFFNNQNEERKNKINDASNSEFEYSKTLNLSICNFDTINPLISKNKDVINISKLIFEPLISLDENYKTEYNIAKECAKISYKTYLVKLDSKIRWQDGEKLTSRDVEFTINELKEVESIYSEDVKNIEGTEIIDDSTIKINLKDNIDFFEYYLNFPILPYHIYENEKMVSSSKTPIGSGRFKIKTIDSKTIILEKNEYYRKNNEENSKVEEINISLYDDMKEIYNNFKLGNIDLVHTSGNNYQEYLGNMGYNAKEYKGREYDFISLNCKDSLLSQKEVRKALSYAIDKNKIVSEVYNNKYYVSDFPFDFGNFLYNDENNKISFSAEKSKNILEEAGWSYQNNKWQKRNSNGKLTILSLELIVQSSNAQRIKVSEEIKKQIEETGIIINIKQVSDNQYIKYLENKNYQMILTGINNGFSPNLEYFYGIDNLAQYENEELSGIMQEISKIEDDNLLQSKYKNIIHIVNDDCAYIGLYRNKETILLNLNMNGEIVPNNYNLFYKIWTWYRKR